MTMQDDRYAVLLGSKSKSGPESVMDLYDDYFPGGIGGGIGAAMIDNWGNDTGTRIEAEMKKYSALPGETIQDARHRYYGSLDAIAGKPAALLTAPGNIQVQGFSAYGDRILYAVYDMIAPPTTQYSFIAELGGPTAETIYGYLGISARPTTTSDAWLARLNNINGASGASYPIPGSGVVGRRSCCIMLTNNASFVEFQSLGSAGDSRSPVAGDGQQNAATYLTLYNAAAGIVTPLLTAAYPAAHNNYQRTAIMQKLLQMSYGE